MMSAPLLSIGSASKTYGSSPALIDASLDLLPGQVHALMGENGAGKSTLIKILAGVVTPDHAEIRLRDRPVRIHDPQDAFNLGLRFIHQELNVVSQLSAAENIFVSLPYPRRAGFLVDWRRLHADAAEVLAQLGIRHIDPREQIARLSPGDQMLIKIASAFVGADQSNASVYVMDEPTAALTGNETARLFRVIGELKAKGCAVLYVTHRMEEIFEIGDMVTVMRDGRVVETRPIQGTTPRDLIRLMTGRQLEQTYPARGVPVGEAVTLEVRDLSTRQISGIHFQLRAGEILGVAGLTGAGRSELLAALIGAERRLTHDVLMDGRPLSPLSPARAWDAGFAYVPEERRAQGLMLSRSIRDNITLPHLQRLSRGGVFLNRSAERATSSAMGKSVQLKATGTEQITRQLSGGNQQKVLFARAMVQTPRVLLLDEPTRGVDVGAKFDIYSLIRDFSARGTAILLASSDLGELLGLCDRILVMRKRRQAAVVEAAGLTAHDLLTLCYEASA
jgi:ribose transport system ATP-binding protein